MTPENTSNHEPKADDARQRKLMSYLARLVVERLGIGETLVVDLGNTRIPDETPTEIIPIITPEQIADAKRASLNTSEIEARMEKFRRDKAGTGEAEMATPLEGLENDRVFMIVPGDESEPAGHMDGGWTVSTVTEESSVTVFKPYLDDAGELHISTRTLPTADFESIQETAAKMVTATTIQNGGDQAAKRVVMVRGLMDKIRRGERLTSDERYGI